MMESQTSRTKVIMKTNMTTKKTERMLVPEGIVMTLMNASQTAARIIITPLLITNQMTTMTIKTIKTTTTQINKIPTMKIMKETLIIS